MNNWRKGIKEKSDFKSKDLYKFYKSTVDNPVDAKTYSYIIKELNKRVIPKIYEGFVFQVPAGLGFIGVLESNTNIVFDDNGQIDMTKSNLSTDWGKTNKLWRDKPELKHKKYIFHENLHTGGRRFRIAWSRKYANLRAIKHYKFKPTRAFARNLTKYINNNPTQQYYDF